MKRSWAVRPGEAGVVTREMLIDALVDGATMLDIAGGVLSVVVGRAPTDVPGEMVMTGALLEWKDRTDARPQPEPAVAVTPQEVQATRNIAEATGADGSAEPEPIAEVQRELADAREERTADAERALDIDPDDGFDYSKLADEDIDEPVTAR